MVITPNSDVILLKCPLELSQDNQINFSSKSTQYNYFYSLPKFVAGTNFTYQRKDNVIRVPAKFDDLIQYNYVMYRNDSYSSKWFYAFIEKMEYVNDGMTAVYIKCDVFQTWQFDIQYKRCFVEREHVNDDTIGKHTVPEGLDLGEFEIVDMKDIPLWQNPDSALRYFDWVPVFCVTKLPTLTLDSGQVLIGESTGIGGVAASLIFFAVDSIVNAKNFIKHAYDSWETTSEAIVNVYMCPRCCVNGDFLTHTVQAGGQTVEASKIHWSASGDDPEGSVHLYPLWNFYQTDQSDTPDGNLNFRLQQPSVLAENYTPVNKKLYTSPFSYIYMSNNAGEDITLNWEDFPIETISGNTMPTISYRKFYVPSASISAKLVFSKYKTYNSADNDPSRMFNYGMSFAKVPTCAWTTDYYTNWLTQNGVNIATSAVSALGTTAVGVATGGIASAMGIISAGHTVANTLAEIRKAQTTPPQAHGDLNSGDVNYCFKRNSISCYFMSVRKEVAQIIDGYFSMYGYKVNSVKVPNITGRANWNYVKTIGSHILGDIPQEDMQEIKNMFDNGLTIWHHTNTFMDYSRSNAIV